MKNAVLSLLLGTLAFGAGFGIYHLLPERAVAPETFVAPEIVSLEATPSPSLAATPKVDTPISLIFGGDVMLGRYVETQAKRNGGGSWLFSGVKDVLSAADFAMVNLESMVRTDATTTPANSLVLRGDPTLLPALADAGIDAVSLANNHVTDMGLSGLQETQKALAASGVKFVGAGETQSAAEAPLIVEVKGQKLGIIASTYGVNFDSRGVVYSKITKERLVTQVEALVPQVDAVLVFLHWGAEYKVVPSADQEVTARALVDAGASMVIGAHPHVPQKVETYKSGVIAYSLGNLVFDQEKGNLRDASALLKIELTGTRVTNIEALPYQIEKYSRPVLVSKESAFGAKVMERLGL